jgi:NodT family efflux transporter outer membrane factor (OMF) lipoprotein
MNIYKYVLTLLFLQLTVSGCITVGPDYKYVNPDAPHSWNANMENGLTNVTADNLTLAEWWKQLGDEVLAELEKSAAEGNLDIKIALSRIREARAMRGISKSRLFPTLNLNSTFEERRDSENMMNGNLQDFGSSNGGDEYEYYMAGFDSGWEIDIFGGLRRSIEAAQAELEASFADFNDILIILMSEVALNYIEMRTYQTRIDIIYKNIMTQEKTYNLNKSRYTAGLIDELALEQSLRNLEQSRSQIPSLETGLIAAKNRLAVLTGKKPGELDNLIANKKQIPRIPPEVAVDIPAEVLRRRPDIRRAERNLAAQTARIGVAVADLYPKFHLLGTIGLESVGNDNFWDASSRFWSVGPSLTWNLFQGGAIRQNIKVQTERQKQALDTYEATVLNALEEVENALTAYAKEQNRNEYLNRAVKAAERTEFLALDQYKAGLTDFYNVLDAQRTLLELQDQFMQSRGEMVANLARLYKALGGGWEYAEELIKTKVISKDKAIDLNKNRH